MTATEFSKTGPNSGEFFESFSPKPAGFPSQNGQDGLEPGSVADRPRSNQWLSDERIAKARRVWFKAYGRVITEDEPMEILKNVRRLAEVLFARRSGKRAMNVVIWARVSSREQREGYSIDAQLRADRERARAKGWNVVREFVVAESAKRGANRVEFKQMVSWVRANAKREEIKWILSHKLDRVCRNMRDAVCLQELEDKCGVRLAFVENQFGPGAAGALSFNMMAAVAQYYSDNLRSEVLKGMDEKVRQGWPTGLAPYGYVNVKDRDEPVKPHPEKSRTLIRMFELYATGSYTLDSLADQLFREGHVFRKSQPRFPCTALSYILTNRFYIGELYRNGQVFEGRSQRLIDRATFDACQDVLHGRNRRTGSPSHPLAGGLLECAF